jgi:hypothetical protein
MIIRPEDERIDFRPKAQFYSWGYLVFTLVCVVLVIWLLTP